MERQVAMMKVVRALQVKDTAGVFSRQLDQDTLEVGVLLGVDVVVVVVVVVVVLMLVVVVVVMVVLVV